MEILGETMFKEGSLGEKKQLITILEEVLKSFERGIRQREKTEEGWT